MSTINISLPSDQVKFVDQLVDKFGFANRSEFIRSVIRLLRHKPEIITDVSTFPFVTTKERSVKNIVAGFARTEKYSKSFLKDLKEGLLDSNYFTP